jgi:hypothetical protein
VKDISFYLALIIFPVIALLTVNHFLGHIKIFLRTYLDVLVETTLAESIYLWLVTLFAFVLPIPLWVVQVDKNLQSGIILFYWLLVILSRLTFYLIDKKCHENIRLDGIIFLIALLGTQSDYQIAINLSLVLLILSSNEQASHSKKIILLNVLYKISILMMIILISMSANQKLYLFISGFALVLLVSKCFKAELLVYLNQTRTINLLTAICLFLAVTRVYSW